jgi:hypothetical protein
MEPADGEDLAFVKLFERSAFLIKDGSVAMP